MEKFGLQVQSGEILGVTLRGYCVGLGVADGEKRGRLCLSCRDKVLMQRRECSLPARSDETHLQQHFIPRIN